MNLDELKRESYEANLALVKHHLVVLTWGNASAFDAQSGIMAIKPSGVPYSELKWQDMVLVDLDGKLIDSAFRPSSDTPTHIVLYKNFTAIRGVVHTHAVWSTIWAQVGLSIPCLGTTHADHFNGEIPCIPTLTEEQVETNYEKNTGLSIVDYYAQHRLSYQETPGCILTNHAPFAWGNAVAKAVENAVALEQCAQMAYHTLSLNKNAFLPTYILKKHYERKHGKAAYYGQANA